MTPSRVFQSAGQLLRGEAAHRVGVRELPWIAMLGMLVAGGFVYGAVMGSYAARPVQALYSGTKVPLFLGISMLLCLPSFYVVNSVLGLRTQVSAALHGLLAAQATLAVTLAALAPVTVVFYVSVDRYPLAIVFNGVQFALATFAGQLILARHYRRLIASDPRHRVTRNAWLVAYVFVAIQMAWVLRPFVGAPDIETRFFREDAWSNAYVRVFRAILEASGLADWTY